MTNAGERNCGRILELLDLYIDRESDSAGNEAVSRHLKECDACSRVLVNRTALRDRLRQAARRIETPASLQARIHTQLDSSRIASARGLSRRQWIPMALAAATLLIAGVSRWYQSGGLRLTRASQEDYIASIAPQVSPAMQVGLTQHVHCAVFRRYPSEPPTVAAMLKDLGPQYSQLIPAMQQHIPAEFHVVMAHLCSRRGRAYVHVIARCGGHLISLLITRKNTGETFADGLRAVTSPAGTELYASGAQRFSLAGFATREHLVYLVSDLDRNRNVATLQAMVPQLRAALREPAV
jgi:anti-sigma factor RsiW